MTSKGSIYVVLFCVNLFNFSFINSNCREEENIVIGNVKEF